MIEDLDLFGVAAYARAATCPRLETAECVQWRLQKNCSLTPRQLATCLVCFSLPGLLAGLAFYALGAPMILALLVLQFSTLVWCFVQYARHASDCEWLTVSRGAIEVQVDCGATRSRSTFSPVAASLRLLDQQQNLIAISERGHSVHIGGGLPRHLRPHLFQNLCNVARQFQ